MHSVRSWLTIPLIALFILTLRAGDAASLTIALELGDNRAKIELPQGEKLLISLPASPRTGSTWKVTSMDSGILRQESDEATGRSSERMGEKDEFTTLFTALKPGTTRLVLEDRCWGGTESTAVRDFSITVTVKSSMKPVRQRRGGMYLAEATPR